LEGLSNAVRAIEFDRLRDSEGYVLHGLKDDGQTALASRWEDWGGETALVLLLERMAEVVPKYSNDVVDLSGTNKPQEQISQFFTCEKEPETGRLLSEDYWFCRTWRNMGGKIYAAPWMDLGHVGTYLLKVGSFQTPHEWALMLGIMHMTFLVTVMCYYIGLICEHL
jgi:hypothetical protein